MVRRFFKLHSAQPPRPYHFGPPQYDLCVSPRKHTDRDALQLLYRPPALLQELYRSTSSKHRRSALSAPSAQSSSHLQLK